MNRTFNNIMNRGKLMTVEKIRAGAACRPVLPPGNALTDGLRLGILQSGESYWPKSGENLMASHTYAVTQNRHFIPGSKSLIGRGV